MSTIRITHRASGTVLAQGPVGWGITPFDGGYYIATKHMRTQRFSTRPIPGLCPYKFIYLWMNLTLPDGTVEKDIGWKYVVPNPLLPFTAWRVAVSKTDPRLRVERRISAGSAEDAE